MMYQINAYDPLSAYHMSFGLNWLLIKSNELISFDNKTCHITNFFTLRNDKVKMTCNMHSGGHMLSFDTSYDKIGL